MSGSRALQGSGRAVVFASDAAVMIVVIMVSVVMDCIPHFGYTAQL